MENNSNLDLGRLLENLPDEREYAISFKSGDILGLKAFEMVDSSISGGADLCVADVVTQIHCDKKFYTVGTSIEFSINEVQKIVDMDNRNEIFNKN